MTKRKWHFCLIDPTCWMEMWLFGMPLRFYWHPTKKFWDIPVLSKISEWRHDKIFSSAVAIEVSPLRCGDCGSLNVSRVQSEDAQPSPGDSSPTAQ